LLRQHNSEEDAVTGRHPAAPLLELLTQPLADRGIDLEDVEISSAGRRRVVRVLIDKDGGISLDDISDATSQVSAMLDDSDVLGESPYTLEVTSPGVDRPLTLPRHWRRNLDRLVRVTPHHGAPFTGRIVSSDEAGATISAGSSQARVAFADVAKARIEIEFSRPEPGAKKRGRAKASAVSATGAGVGSVADEAVAGLDDDDKE
jgi:ribosome maturation factor RimP